MNSRKLQNARVEIKIRKALASCGCRVNARRIASELQIAHCYDGKEFQALKRLLTKMAAEGKIECTKVKCWHKTTQRDNLFGGCASGIHYENQYSVAAAEEYFAPGISVQSVTVDVDARDAGVSAYFARQAR